MIPFLFPSVIDCFIVDHRRNVGFVDDSDIFFVFVGGS
jgi:hypothetical protein